MRAIRGALLPAPISPKGARLSALGPCLPNGRVSAAMKYRQDNNAVILCTEMNAEREMFGYDTPNVPADNGKLERVFRCQRQTTVNFGHELKSKANSLGLIPRTCLDELRTGGTAKSDGQAHCLILARAAVFTSLQGTTSSGLARWSARRRSRSVACASVNAGAAPRPTIPSQIASTSSICSSISSTRACCKSCVFMIWTPFKLAYRFPHAGDSMRNLTAQHRRHAHHHRLCRKAPPSGMATPFLYLIDPTRLAGKRRG